MARHALGVKRLNIFAPYRKILKRGKKIANRVDSLKKEYRLLSDEELSNKTQLFLDRLSKGNSLDSIMVDAFATVRETVYRVTGLFAYKVQIIGAYVLHIGDFAELYTGEGKTLVCVLAAYLNALLKRGVHIVTVNEYLAQRDAKFCAECLNPLGISVGYNLAEFNPEDKRKMFACDITYTTNSELGFDYLRDNMTAKYEHKVLRGLNFAIIDEGDSILIDEARTPLIISGQPKNDTSLYVEANRFAKSLNEDDYKIDAEANSIILTDSGVEKAEEYFKIKKFYAIENSNLVHKVKNALMANYIFQHGVQYIVRNDEVVLVDQFTGRILEGRSYNAGLQQAIQAKEYVKIEPENVTVATITYQSFFRLYKKLAACSGTAITEEEEFMKIYNMVVVPVPTNRPILRKDYNDYVFDNKISKWHHICEEIEKVHNETKQPILVGTGSIEESEELANLLRNKGLNFELLNAKNHSKEAEIVKNAGQLGAITISTNMAGRGTDIKLGEGVREIGGLYVIGTDKAESRRVDNQLRGRAGRQGDPGKTRFFISLEDEIFRRFAFDRMEKSMNKISEDVYDSWFFTKLLNSAQGKIEGFNFDSRKNLIDYDSVLSNQRELIYKQRDEILVTKDNASLLKKMAKYISEELTSKYVDEKNGIYIDSPKITSVLNRMIFNSEIIEPDYFKNKIVSEAKDLILKLINTSIDMRIKILGKDESERIIRNILIQNLDYQWTNHIDTITKIREGVQLRSLEQKSPLNIYVEEADKHFNEMRQVVARNCILSFHRIYVPGIVNEMKMVLNNLDSKDDVVLKPKIDSKILDILNNTKFDVEKQTVTTEK